MGVWMNIPYVGRPSARRVAFKGANARWRQKMAKEKNYNDVKTTCKCRNVKSHIVHKWKSKTNPPVMSRTQD